MNISEAEAKEMSKICKIVFPHAKQLLYTLERPDGKGGQYFNLTQLSIKIEVDPCTRLYFDYHIVVYFDKPTTNYIHNEILTMTTTRLAHMSIKMGIGLVEPIYISCKEKETTKLRFWTCTINVYLKYPKVDDIDMFKGLRPFILTMDKIHNLGKLYKCDDSIARNNLLFTKIENPKLYLISSNELQTYVRIESFKRGYDYEIASMQKIEERNMRMTHFNHANTSKHNHPISCPIQIRTHAGNHTTNS